MPKQAVFRSVIARLQTAAAIAALASNASAQQSLLDEGADTPHRSAQESCTACHQPDLDFSHPTGVVPSMATPSELPLEDGRLSCITCHDGTPSPQGEEQSTRHAPLRLGMGASQLCAECHNPAIVQVSNMHALSQGKAHLKWKTPQVGGLRKAQRSAHSERDSTSCLSCHDGSVSQDIGHAGIRDLWPTNESARAPGSNPIDIEYIQTNQDADDPLVPAADLDPRIRLFDNRVTCESCHSAFSQKRHNLVMSNLGSQLCLGCHQY